MMKKAICLFLLFLSLSLALHAKETMRSVKSPECVSQNTSSVYIDEVILEPDSTTIKFHAFGQPNTWIRIASGSYLKVNEKKYPAANGIGIDFDKEFWLPKSGEAYFAVSFAPIPIDTKSFDFIEGDVMGAFIIEGVDLNESPNDAPAMPMNPSPTNAYDLEQLLKLGGYENYSFDLTPLLSRDYMLQLIAQEYENGELVATNILGTRANKTHLSAFPPEDQKEILEQGLAADAEHDIFTQSDRLSIRLMPVKDDSIRLCSIDVENIAIMRFPFALKKVSGGDMEICMYETRPFEKYEFHNLEFCPLLLLGSFWYDEQFNIFRFCGENEISHDLNSKILKHIPHYYIIGIRPLPI